MNWNDLANTKAADVERPPQAPEGYYIATFTGKKAEQGESRQKQTPQAKFPIRIVEPYEGTVDADELAKFTETKELPFDASFTQYFTPGTNWRFTELATGLGLSDDQSIVEQIEAIVSVEEPFVIQAKRQRNDSNPADEGFVRFENPVPLAAFREQQAARQGG